jgi:hypothetical protein
MPTIATVSGDVYVLGGLAKMSILNDLYRFNCATLAVENVQTGGESPSNLIGHAAATISSALVVWGGDTSGLLGDPPANHVYDDGLYVLDLGE